MSRVRAEIHENDLLTFPKIPLESSPIREITYIGRNIMLPAVWNAHMVGSSDQLVLEPFERGVVLCEQLCRLCTVVRRDGHCVMPSL